MLLAMNICHAYQRPSLGLECPESQAKQTSLFVVVVVLDFCLFSVFETGYPRLALNLLRSHGWLWNSDPPASTSWIRGLQACTPMPGLWGARDGSQGFVQARQTLWTQGPFFVNYQVFCYTEKRLPNTTNRNLLCSLWLPILLQLEWWRDFYKPCKRMTCLFPIFMDHIGFCRKNKQEVSPVACFWWLEGRARSNKSLSPAPRPMLVTLTKIPHGSTNELWIHFSASG